MTHIPEDLLTRFKSYYQRTRSWRSLRLVMEDFRTDDKTVHHCLKVATDRGDFEGERLATTLLILSRAERRRISIEVEETCQLN